METRHCSACRQWLALDGFPRDHRRFVCRACLYASQRKNGNTAHAALITEARTLAKRLFNGYDTLFSVAGLRCAGLVGAACAGHIMPRDPALPLTIPDNIHLCDADQKRALLAAWQATAGAPRVQRAAYMQLLDAFTLASPPP